MKRFFKIDKKRFVATCIYLVYITILVKIKPPSSPFPDWIRLIFAIDANCSIVDVVVRVGVDPRLALLDCKVRPEQRGQECLHIRFVVLSGWS